ncbi:MAG TPA: CHAT domain-containing protein [Blastocatellia bacterium]|nr:CHAT domain-containing protein [Blastocatellia bacterium]
MREFYRLRESESGLSKAEALRQAQLALLRGSIKGGRSTERGIVVKPASEDKTSSEAFKENASAPYAHPFYWAPFILIGNWK